MQFDVGLYVTFICKFMSEKDLGYRKYLVFYAHVVYYNVY